MTVLENVVAAQRSFSWGQLGRIAVSGPEAEAAEELLEYVGMRAFRDQKARALSYGQQKLVELAQVLMLDPKLILLDEPAGGINPVLIDRMSEMIRELNSYGKTFLIVEHNMPFVLGLCDPVHVLGRGRTMASGTPDEIQKDPAVVDAYLGDDFVLEAAEAATPGDVPWRRRTDERRPPPALRRRRRVRRRRRAAGRRDRRPAGGRWPASSDRTAPASPRS